MTESKHTPLPWHLGTEGPWKGAVFGGNDYRVADVEPYGHGIAEANAAYIVQRVNSHDKLVEALRKMLRCSALRESGSCAQCETEAKDALRAAGEEL